jgi:Caspase domain
MPSSLQTEHGDPNLKTRALFIGINTYAHAPLTSCVQDAVALQAKLIAAGVVDPSACTLLTSPPVEGTHGPPDRATLGRILLGVRDNADHYDRLIVFFSGHGEMTFSDSDSSQPRTVILPADFTGHPSERYLNISVDDLLNQFRVAGPREQLFILDCCRKQADTISKSAGGGPLSWPAPATTGEEAIQSVLYGVALKGVARGMKAQGGVMTRHILASLDPKGPAATYMVERDEYAVTIEGLADFVSAEVGTQIKDAPGFEAGYDLPSLDRRGWRKDRKPAPLLTIASSEVPPQTLTIVIEPEEAVPFAEVLLTASANRLHKWPPSGAPYSIAPGKYGLRATLTAANTPFLTPQPAFEPIEIRRNTSKVVRFSRAGEPPRGAIVTLAEVKEPVPESLESYELRGYAAGAGVRTLQRSLDFSDSQEELIYPPGTGHIEAIGHDEGTSVEFLSPALPSGRIVDFLQFDYDTHSWKYSEFVPPGYYRIRFRLGQEIFSRADVEVSEGRRVEVHARAGATPLILDTLPERFITDFAVSHVGQVSESIGNIQGGVVATLLPALAMRPFDEKDELLRHFPADLRLPSDTWPANPVSVIVAVDGALEKDQTSFESLLSSAQLTVHPLRSTHEPARSYMLERFPACEARTGLQRYGRVIFSAPDTNFSITLHSRLLRMPATGVVAALPDRVTVVTFLLDTKGACTFGLNLLQYPARADTDEAGHTYYTEFPARLRALQVAQSLFAANQLLAVPISGSQLGEMLWFKWIDPLIAVMALLEIQRRTPNRVPLYETQEATVNLVRYFGYLPDSLVIRAIYSEIERPQLLASLHASNAVPVLAESLRQLIFLAQAAGHYEGNVWLEALTRRAVTLQLDQPWSLTFG